MKLNEINDPIKEFLEKNSVKNYTINSDGTIDVDGEVDINTRQSKLPVKFGKVTGVFDCSHTQLTSLEGAPSHVGSYFSCSDNLLTSLEWAPGYVGSSFYCSNNKLTSLKGAPNIVKGNFYCSDNKLTSLHDIHKHVKEFNGRFYCYNNPIKDSVLGLLLIKGVKVIILDNDKVQKILNKYLGNGRSGVIDAQQELLDAGLDEYAKL